MNAKMKAARAAVENALLAIDRARDKVRDASLADFDDANEIANAPALLTILRRAARPLHEFVGVLAMEDARG